MVHHTIRATAGLLALAAVAACTDDPSLPAVDLPEPPRAAQARIQCTADVAQATVTCVDVPPSTGGARASLTLGGQHVYLRLASAASAYDAGAGIFRMDVTLQNLLAQPMGTPDGTTATGARVFFASLGATEGNGVVEVANPDDVGLFVSGTAPFFAYPGIIEPRGTSPAREWRFSVPSTVTRFAFTVYVETELAAEDGVLRWQVQEGGGNGPVNEAVNGVWAGGPRNVWAVGGAGSLLHFDGTSWTAMMNRQVSSTLRSVWGADAYNVYAAGLDAVLRYDGNRWARTWTGGVGVELHAVSGASAAAVYAVGSSTELLKRGGLVVRMGAGGAIVDTLRLDGPTRASDGHRLRVLRGVAAAGDTVVAVGEQFDGVSGTEGVVVRSVDAGTTWSALPSPGPVVSCTSTCPGRSRTLYGVAMRDGVVLAVGEQNSSETAREGVILRSADGGATWTEALVQGPVYSLTRRHLVLRGVAVAASGELFAFGQQVNAQAQFEPLVLRSGDGGATWSAVAGVSGGTILNNGAVVGTDLFAVGDGGVVVRRSDGGWSQPQAAGGGGTLRSVWMGADGGALAVGSLFAAGHRDGWVRRWSGGAWSSTLLPGPASNDGYRDRTLADVAGTGGRALAVGFQRNASGLTEGVVLLSGDGGASWSTQLSPGALVSCGAGCTTRSRTLSGAAVADAQTLFAAGRERAGQYAFDALVLRSGDGGATWTESRSQGPSTSCGSGCTGRSRTLNAVATGEAGRVHAVGFQGATVFHAGASVTRQQGVVLTSADGGASWSEHVAPATGTGEDRRLTGVWVGGDTVVVVGYEQEPPSSGVGVVLRSTDGGASWTAARVRSTRATRTHLTRVWGTRGGHLFAAGEQGVLLRSRDGGVTWRDEASGTLRILHGVGGRSAGEVLAVGDGGTIVRGTR